MAYLVVTGRTFCTYPPPVAEPPANLRAPTTPASPALRPLARSADTTPLKPPPVTNGCCGGGCKNHGPMREEEGPSRADIEKFSGVTRNCPACHKEVFDDAEICYHCGEAFEKTSAGVSGPPTWIIVTAITLSLLLVVGLLFGLRWF